MPKNPKRPVGEPLGDGSDTTDPFGPDHYTRDWDFLEGLAQEWAAIRAETKLGSKATLEQIEACHDAIFGPEAPERPHLLRLECELENDAVLRGTLAAHFYRRLEAGERQGFDVAQVVRQVLLRIFWTVARNANTWHAVRGQPGQVHWARFWNTQNLITELRRAIRDLGTRFQRPDGETVTANYECDHRGRPSSRPEDVAETLEEAFRGLGLQPNEETAYRHWYHSDGDWSEAEEGAVARAYGMSREELNAVIRKVVHRFES